MVHGSCSENGETNKILAGALGLSEGFNLQWFYMENVAEWVAGQGYAVLMIGLSDDDGAGYADGANGVVDNSWPSAAYSKFLLAAIDHLAGSAAKANVPVDASSSQMTPAIRDTSDSILSMSALRSAGTTRVVRIVASDAGRSTRFQFPNPEERRATFSVASSFAS